MKVYISKYELQKTTSLNSKDISQTQQGALVKIIDENQRWGVADLCPWPNLGDLDLDEEIQTKGILYQRSFDLALDDQKARINRRSLLSDKILENNWLITDFKTFDSQSSIVGTVKVKGSNQLDHFNLFLEKLSQHDVKIRIDFNSSLSTSEFSYFLNLLPQSVVAKIEYIEDPTIWNPSQWKIWNQKIPLAIDFAYSDPFKFPESWSYLIIKPSRQKTKTLVNQCHALKKKFTLTSAMDHPVGIAHGLRYAQSYAEITSGFLTLNLYQKTEFDRYFKVEKNGLGFSEIALDDHGIGMTSVLNSLSWVPL
jgi:O-succinylbenzoate synthase